MNCLTPQTHDTDTTRVLIIDDDPRVRDLLKKRLELEGFPLSLAASAEEGLALYLDAHCRGEAYDALILDLRLGTSDGRELLSLLRSADEELTVLMISGESAVDSAIECIELGADDYLGKPIKIWDLRDRLSTAMGRRSTIYHRAPGIEDAGMRFGEAFAGRSCFSQAEAKRPDDRPLDRPPLDDQQRQNNKARASGTRDQSQTLRQLRREMGGETDEGQGEGECAPGRVGHSPRPDVRVRSEENEAMAERLAERSPGRAISPPGALIHIATCLEARHGKLGEGREVAKRLAKLSAFLAAKLGLRPLDLEALCLAAQVQNLRLAARASPDSQQPYPQKGDSTRGSGADGSSSEGIRGFACGFLAAIAQQSGANCEVCELAAKILCASTIPSELRRSVARPEPSAKIACLATLLLAAQDDVRRVRACSSDPDSVDRGAADPEGLDPECYRLACNTLAGFEPAG